MIRVRFWVDVVLPATLLCWIAVLAYSAFVGEQSYRQLAMLQDEIVVEDKTLTRLRERRLYLEHRADLLSSHALDPDMIDEQIRRTLGYSREGDKIIPRRSLDW